MAGKVSRMPASMIHWQGIAFQSFAFVDGAMCMVARMRSAAIVENQRRKVAKILAFHANFSN